MLALWLRLDSFLLHLTMGARMPALSKTLGLPQHRLNATLLDELP